MKSTEAKNINPESYHVPLQDVYVGMAASSTLSEMTDARSSDVHMYQSHCQKFSMEIIYQIQSRFDMKAEYHDMVDCINPENASALHPPSLGRIISRSPYHKVEQGRTKQKKPIEIIKTSSKTRASRCESCKAVFKEKGIIRQRFMIGNYGPRPFFKKSLKTWHHGTRNYYYCARRQCLVSLKSDIKGEDIHISSLQNELLRSDLETFEKNTIYDGKIHPLFSHHLR